MLMAIGGVEYHGHTWELGARRAKDLLFTGRGVDAQEAERRSRQACSRQSACLSCADRRREVGGVAAAAAVFLGLVLMLRRRGGGR